MISLLMSCHVAIISSKEPLKRGGDFMNSICIYRRVRGSYIYTGGEEYTKNLMEKYNNKKINIYLIPLSNSWWISNTEFEKVKLMMSMSLSFREKICQLKL
jgi:hypothetical protein